MIAATGLTLLFLSSPLRCEPFPARAAGHQVLAPAVPDVPHARILDPRLRLSDPSAGFTDSDLVVGYPDTMETRVISGRYSLQGNIYVVNHGTLIIDHADFTLRGNICVVNQGAMRIRGGTFTVVQLYAYQFGCAVQDRAALRLESAGVTTSNQSWGAGLTGAAELGITDTRLSHGFFTITPMQHARVAYSDCNVPSEFVVFDSSEVRLARCTTALVWLSFPGGSEAHLTLPAGDTALAHWEIHDSIPVSMGIGYRVELDTVAGVMWGTFPMRGSIVDIQHSRLRSTGLIFNGHDSIHVSGLVDDQHYEDWNLPVGDRTFHLFDTDLQTWNLYPFDTVRLAVESSIFGEMLASGQSYASLNNSICDGSGGYIGSNDNCRFDIFGSTINTQFISRGRSFLIAGYANLRLWPAQATGGSIVLLLFCSTELEPQAKDTSLLVISDFDLPPEAQTGGDIPVLGTADIRSGPEQPVGFASYRMLYAPADSPGAWHAIGPVHDRPVVADTLDVWNARDLEPGLYLVDMKLKLSTGDSVEPVRAFTLLPSAIASRARPETSTDRVLLSPNPFRSAIRISFPAPAVSRNAVSIYDVQGRLVRTLAARVSGPGSVTVVWDGSDSKGRRSAPGLYIAGLPGRGVVLTRKLVLSD